MKSKTKNNSPWLIPLLCFLVIVFSLIFNLARQISLPSSLVLPPTVPTRVPLFSTPETKAVFNFLPSILSLKPGGQEEVELAILFPKQVVLDGINVILSYNPEAVVVQKVIPQKVFSFSSVTQDPLLGRISATFLEEKGNGVVLSGQVKLMTLSLKSKTATASEIFVFQEEKGPTSVITQNNTSKKLNFEAMKLNLLTE